MIGPILNIPLALQPGEIQSARSLLDLSKRLESMIGHQATTIGSQTHPLVTLQGTPTVFCVNAENFTDDFRDRLSQIEALSGAHAPRGHGFLSEMSESIRFCAEGVRTLPRKAFLAYHIAPATDGGTIRYAPLGYANTDLEKGIAYFLGLHFRPIFPKGQPIRLFQTMPADVGFGATAALSLFSGDLQFTDLIESTGYLNPRRVSGSKWETENGWRMIP